MRQRINRLTVFTKPWKYPLPELGRFVHDLGFDGVELPVRPGFQVDPDHVSPGLCDAARVLGDYGVSVSSIAGPTDERTIEACAEAGVPIIRICVAIPKNCGYLEHEAEVQRGFDRLVPALDRCGITIGVQNHCDRQVANAMGVRHLIEQYDARHIAAVWDPAHCALNGEIPELAADILWPHLCMVNLKNAFWRRTSNPDADVATYQHLWTSGRQGLCSWPEVTTLLKERGYSGPVCLTAEYSDHQAVDRLIAEDSAFAQSLLS